MTYTYSAIVQSIFSANSDSLAIEITAPAGITIKIKKIRITVDDGTSITSYDYHEKVKLVTESVAGTGGTSYTPIAIDQNTPTSVCTVNVAPAATKFTVGTISKTYDIISIHSSINFLWQAADEDDKFVITAGSIFGIVVNPAH